MDLTDDDLIALVSDAPDPEPADSLEEDLDFDMVVAVTAPPLLEMRQQLAHYSAFIIMAETSILATLSVHL